MGAGKPSTVRNAATGTCLGTLIGDPTHAGPCTSATAAQFVYNASNYTVAIAVPTPGSVGYGAVGACLDVNGGRGPDIDLYTCHPLGNVDYVHQQFKHDPSTGSLHTLPGVAGGTCLTLDRSQPPPPGTVDPWDGRWKLRLNDMLRLLKSSGMNGVALEDVNSCGIDTQSIDRCDMKLCLSRI